jgi:hypothetical protein
MGTSWLLGSSFILSPRAGGVFSDSLRRLARDLLALECGKAPMIHIFRRRERLLDILANGLDIAMSVSDDVEDNATTSSAICNLTTSANL